MSNPVINSSFIKCSMSCSLPPGVPIPKSPSYPPGAPGQMLVAPSLQINICGAPAANIMDTNGKITFPPSNSCQSQINPTVISASTAASIPPAPPSFVPAPCTPIFSSPWSPGSITAIFGGQPALNSTSIVPCNMGGIVEITSTPAVSVEIP